MDDRIGVQMQSDCRLETALAALLLLRAAPQHVLLDRLRAASPRNTACQRISELLTLEIEGESSLPGDPTRSLLVMPCLSTFCPVINVAQEGPDSGVGSVLQCKEKAQRPFWLRSSSRSLGASAASSASGRQPSSRMSSTRFSTEGSDMA